MTLEKVIDKIESVGRFKRANLIEDCDIRVYEYGESYIQIWDSVEGYGIAIVSITNKIRTGYYCSLLNELNDIELTVQLNRVMIKISSSIFYLYNWRAGGKKTPLF